MKTLHVNLNKKSLKNLEVVHRLTHSSNKTTALASALNIARILLEEHQKGNKIIIQDDVFEQELSLN